MNYAVTSRRSRGHVWALALALVAFALLALAGRANATTYTPTTGPALVQAVIDANNNPGPDTILLNNAGVGGLIYFPDQPMVITDDLVIKKGGKPSSTFQARITGQSVNPPQSDLFTVSAGVSAKFDTITIQTASDFGFGVFHNFGTMVLERSTISGNAGTDLLNEADATLTVNNSTISDNVGSPALNDNGGTTTFNNSSILRHGTYGGVGSTGTLTLNNTVLAENTPNCFIGTTPGGAGSLDDDGTCGVAHSNVPAQIGPVQANGGPTPTARPAAGSPLINGGVNSLCPTTDQKYFVRADSGCDIGSFEVGAAADTTAPSCVVTALRNGPPKQQDVTATDSGSGLDTNAISGVSITNGAVAFNPFTAPSRAGLVLTATKTDQAQLTRWSFTATDLAGNATNCS
jgi:hypothetical protein